MSEREEDKDVEGTKCKSPRYSGSETLERRQEDLAQSHGRGWKRGKPVALRVEPLKGQTSTGKGF